MLRNCVPVILIVLNWR